MPAAAPPASAHALPLLSAVHVLGETQTPFPLSTPGPNCCSTTEKRSGVSTQT